MSTGSQVQTSLGSIGFTLYDDGRSISLSLPPDWPSKLTVEDGIKLLLGLEVIAKKEITPLNWDGLSFTYLPPTFWGKTKLESLLSRSSLI